MSDEKTPRLTFETPTVEEERQIRQGLNEYVPEKVVNHLLEDASLVIGKGRRQEVFLLSPRLWELFQQIRPHRHPYYLGLYLGTLTDEELQLSLPVLHHLADDVKDTAKVVVNSKGEQRFLYGHVLRKPLIVHKPSRPQKEQKVLVLNNNGEGLGYGRVKSTKPEEFTITNQLDLGWYLRRGK